MKFLHFSLLSMALFLLCGSPAFSAASKPNVIVVLIDDMGWSDLSCFGGKDVKTENIDRLASEGIKFQQFYVNSPICSPSRVAITTGQYPQRWKISSYLDKRKMNQKRGLAQWLDPAAPILARQLQKNGYATGHFGKWHMGGQRDVADAPPPSSYGFDQSLVNFEGMGAKLLPLTLTPSDAQPGRIWQDAERLGQPVTWMQRSEITSGFVNAALSFIDQAQAANKPFYINLWPDDVHSPFFPPLSRWGKTSARSIFPCSTPWMNNLANFSRASATMPYCARILSSCFARTMATSQVLVPAHRCEVLRLGSTKGASAHR